MCVCGGGIEKKSGCRHLWKKSEFPVSPGMENSFWLKGNKSIIPLTRVDHDCMQERLAACRSCHHWYVPWFVMLTAVFSTKKDVLLLIGEAEYKLVSGGEGEQRTFWRRKSKTSYRKNILQFLHQTIVSWSMFLMSATPSEVNQCQDSPCIKQKN